MLKLLFEAALDDVSENNNASKFIDSSEPFEMRSVPLRCSGSTGCNSGMRRARLNSGVGAKLMVFEASQFPKLDKVTVFCPGLRDPNVLLEGLAKQNNETQCFVRWANKFQRR